MRSRTAGAATHLVSFQATRESNPRQVCSSQLCGKGVGRLASVFRLPVAGRLEKRRPPPATQRKGLDFGGRSGAARSAVGSGRRLPFGGCLRIAGSPHSFHDSIFYYSKRQDHLLLLALFQQVTRLLRIFRNI